MIITPPLRARTELGEVWVDNPRWTRLVIAWDFTCLMWSPKFEIIRRDFTQTDFASLLFYRHGRTWSPGCLLLLLIKLRCYNRCRGLRSSRGKLLLNDFGPEQARLLRGKARRRFSNWRLYTLFIRLLLLFCQNSRDLLLKVILLVF